MKQMDSILYINGLSKEPEHPKLFEVCEFTVLRMLGVRVEYASVEWRSNRLGLVLDELEDTARELADAGSLAIVGYSAGGSMAMNVFGRLRTEPDVAAVSIAGRLSAGDYHALDPRSLESAAHLRGTTVYKGFYNSVMHFENEVLPTLSTADKSKMTILKPRHDFVVPKHTMDIQGVETVTLPAKTHHGAGVLGLRHIRATIEEQQYAATTS